MFPVSFPLFRIVIRRQIPELTVLFGVGALRGNHDEDGPRLFPAFRFAHFLFVLLCLCNMARYPYHDFMNVLFTFQNKGAVYVSEKHRVSFSIHHVSINFISSAFFSSPGARFVFCLACFKGSVDAKATYEHHLEPDK